MKNMKTIKSIVAMLVMVLALGCVSITAEAATKTEKLTLYVGEQVAYNYIGLGKVKSVKSNKSKIVKASKYKSGSKMVAKKNGKAKVTVKGTKGTYIYNVTVKAAPKFNVTVTPRADGYINVDLQNKSSVYFDSVTVEFTYRDAAGNAIGSDIETFYYVGGKKKSVSQGYPSFTSYNLKDTVDWSKTSYNIKWDRSIGYKYSDYTKKISFNQKEVTESGRKYLQITFKTSYKGKDGIWPACEVIYYDAAGNVVDVQKYFTYLSGSKKYRTSTEKHPMDSEAVSYKIVNKRAYMKKYSK